jgi:ring-1,2-phenylacetyl-CoA epoxidase subunit PaaC
LDSLWPYTGELLTTDADEIPLIETGVIPNPASLSDTWNTTVNRALQRATLQRPADAWMQSGGRGGRHTEHLGYLLAEMQYLQRTYPGATW